MHFLSLSLAVVLSVVSFDTVKAESLSFYRDNACPEGKPIEGLQAREVLSIDEFFATEGLLGTNSKFGQGEDILGVDEIYADDNLTRLVLTKFCLEPIKFSDIGKVVEIEPGDFLYHVKTPAGLPVALYFTGHTRASVEAVTSSLSSALAKAAKEEVSANESAPAWWSPAQWISSAWAGSQHTPGSATDIERIKKLRDRRQGAEALKKGAKASVKAEGGAPAQKKDTLRDVFSNVAHCMKGLGKGVYNTTIGVLEFAARSIFSFVKATSFAVVHPKEAWKSVTKGTKDIVDTIRNFQLKDFVKKGAAGFKAMPTVLKTEFICRLIAQIGTSAALAIFAAPTLSAQAIVLWEVLSRYKTMGKFKQWFFDGPPPGAPGHNPVPDL